MFREKKIDKKKGLPPLNSLGIEPCEVWDPQHIWAC